MAANGERGLSEDWDFYFCTVDHQPASIFLDLGIRESVPVAGREDLVWLRLYMKSPREDGMSGKEEYDALVELEDALGTALSTHSDRLQLVGRNTSDGTRDFYYYADNGTWAEATISSAMVQFPTYEFEVGSRHDPNWDAYLEFLYPSERDMQMIQNGRVLAVLERDGDQHDVVRSVSHWVYFDGAAARERFVVDVSAKGFKEVSRCDDASPPRPYGVTVSGETDVNYKSINNVTLQLFDLAKEHGGEYDGWETSVEKRE